MAQPVTQPVHAVGLSSSRSHSWYTVVSPTATLQALTDLFNSSQFRDGIKFFAIGVAISTTKTLLSYVWDHIRRLFLRKALIRDNDPAYQAIMRYVIDASAWAKSVRDVEVSSYPRMPYDYARDEDDGGTGGELVDLSSVHLGVSGDSLQNSETRVHFFPLATDSFRFNYEGTPVWCTRKRDQIGDSNFQDTLELNFLTFSSAPLRRFFVEARLEFARFNSGKIRLFSFGKYNNWEQTATRPKRFISSIHLPGTTKEMLMADAKGFLLPSNRRFYSERGLPYRRGYLLYGTPGSGKTSTVHALASELDLPIYTVSLSSKRMTNAMFQEMIASVPSKSIVLIEDIDAVFQTRVMERSSDASSDDVDSGAAAEPMSRGGSALRQAQEAAMAAANTTDVQFSSLLNAIDGVSAPEGRILIMTTNHREMLDEALIRPGRIDLQIAYTNATKSQILQLFTRWYESQSHSGTAAPEGLTLSSSNDNNLGGGVAAEGDDKQAGTGAVALSYEDLRDLAAEFVAQIPEGGFSVAAIQGYLLLHKDDPHAAVNEVGKWVSEQRR